jgi:hypothetical protein
MRKGKQALAICIVVLCLSSFGAFAAFAQQKALTAKAGPHSVDLAWVNPAAGTFTGDKVYRATGLCPQTTFTVLQTFTVPTAAYSDTGVTATQQFCYYVTAVNTCTTCTPQVAESLPSNNVSATIPADTNTPPAAPTAVTATPH